MNRIDRLFGIILQLQQRRRVRAQDLAARFEVSERTIYRDMTALSEVGVPIAALPGEGYELMEGYYLRPLVFTPDEASALSLAAQMFLSQASGRVAAAEQAALAKITAVLPEATRQQTATLLEMMQFMLPPTRFNLDDERLVLLQQAISQHEEWLAFGDMAEHKAHDLRHIIHIHVHAFGDRQLVAEECCIL
jgi:predicted DNA-binding transcriptional regulator YafY